MSPIQQLLSRSAPYRGLGLIAFMSALIGPLTLEVIFNHADLWFSMERNWQEGAFPLVWQVWTSLGVFLTLGWGIDRGFVGLDSETQKNYSSVLSLMGVGIYALFGLPCWGWMASMNLIEGVHALQAILLSISIMSALALLASQIEIRFSALHGMITSLTIGMSILWFSWGWIW